MPTKYCEKHQIWYDYRETCPECYKFVNIASDVVGGVLAATIGGVIVGGKKIHKMIQEDKAAKNEEEEKMLDEMIDEEIKKFDLINNPTSRLYCPECGNKLLGNIKFCTKCGTKL